MNSSTIEQHDVIQENNGIITLKIVSNETLPILEQFFTTHQVTSITIDCPIPPDCKQSIVALLKNQTNLNTLNFTEKCKQMDILDSLVATQNLPVLEQLITNLFDTSSMSGRTYTDFDAEKEASIKLIPDVMNAIAKEILEKFKPNKLLNIDVYTIHSAGIINGGMSYQLITYLNKSILNYPTQFLSGNEEKNIRRLTRDLYSFLLEVLIHHRFEYSNKLNKEPNVLILYLCRLWYLENINSSAKEKTFALIKTYLDFIEIIFENFLNDYEDKPSNESLQAFQLQLKNIYSILNRKAIEPLNKLNPDNIDHTQLVLNIYVIQLNYGLKIYNALKKSPIPFERQPLLEDIKKCLFEIKRILDITPRLLNSPEDWDENDTIFEAIKFLTYERRTPINIIVSIIEILFPRPSRPIEKTLAVCDLHSELFLIAARCYFKTPNATNIAEKCARKHLSCLTKKTFSFDSLDNGAIIDEEYIICIKMLANFDNAAKIMQELLTYQDYDPEFFKLKLNELKITITQSNATIRYTGYELIDVILQYTDYMKKFNLTQEQWETRKIPMFFGFLSSDPNFNIENLRRFIPECPNRIDTLKNLVTPLAQAQATHYLQDQGKEVEILLEQQMSLVEKCEHLQQENDLMQEEIDLLTQKIKGKRSRDQAGLQFNFFQSGSNKDDDNLSAPPSKRQKGAPPIDDKDYSERSPY